MIGRADALRDGDRRIVDVGGRSIGVFNVGGRYYALRNACPHQGGPLCAGQLWGSLASSAPASTTSPPAASSSAARGADSVELDTGRSWFDPARTRVGRYEVSVATAIELTEGPYAVETYAVGLDGEYLVLELP